MDRNGAPGVLEETTEESMRETLRWLDACQDLRHIKPILTPRFTPSCTNELMAFLGKLAAERDLPVQSHLSENRAEMDWVHQLHPDCKQYWETYKKYGLWNDRTVMAHCVWSDERERQGHQGARRGGGPLCRLQSKSLLRRGAGTEDAGRGRKGGSWQRHRRRRSSGSV